MGGWMCWCECECSGKVRHQHFNSLSDIISSKRSGKVCNYNNVSNRAFCKSGSIAIVVKDDLGRGRGSRSAKEKLMVSAVRLVLIICGDDDGDSSSTVKVPTLSPRDNVRGSMWNGSCFLSWEDEKYSS